MGLSVVVADGGSLFNFSPVPARFQLVRKTGFDSASEPPFVDVVLTLPDGGASNSTAMGQSRAFNGSLVADADGTYSVVGSVDLTNEDGGVEHFANPPATFAIDTTPPIFSVTPPSAAPYVDTDAGIFRDPGMTSAYRRDDIVTISVTSNDTEVDSSSVRLLVTPPGSAEVEYTTSGSCSDGGVGYCALYTIDLAALPFPALRANVGLNVRGSDLAGNLNSSPASVSLPVTRWNFARLVSSSALRASPVVASDGRLIVAAQGGGIWALGLDGGTSILSTEPVLTSPSIGFTGSGGGDAEVLFVQVNASRNNIYGALRYFNLNSAGSPQLGADCGKTSVAIGGAIPTASTAILGDGSTGVRAVGLGVYGLTAVYEYYLVQGGPFYGCDQLADSGLPSASFPANFVATGTTVIVPNDDGRLTKAQSSAGVFSSLEQFPSSPLAVGTVNGVALPSNSRVMGGGGGGVGIGALFALDIGSGADAGALAGTPVSSPVVTAAGEYVGLFRSTASGGQAEARKYPATMSADAGVVVTWSSAVAFPTGVSPGASSPVLGENDVAYFVSNNASLLAVQQSTWTKQYEGGTGTLSVGSVLSSPTIGCNYRRPGTGTGVLYWATDNGYVVSYVVDSPGLDSSAIWPKYQHDERNTGNLNTSVATCP